MCPQIYLLTNLVCFVFTPDYFNMPNETGKSWILVIQRKSLILEILILIRLGYHS